jgi:hypothetical protein
MKVGTISGMSHHASNQTCNKTHAEDSPDQDQDGNCTPAIPTRLNNGNGTPANPVV